MDPPARKEKSKVKEPVSRVEKAKQKSAQQELKQRQRAEVRLRRGPAYLPSAGGDAEERNRPPVMGSPACLQAEQASSRFREMIVGGQNGEVPAHGGMPS